MKYPSTCYLCSGTGKVSGTKCTHCDGTGIPVGVVRQPESVGEPFAGESEKTEYQAGFDRGFQVGLEYVSLNGLPDGIVFQEDPPGLMATIQKILDDRQSTGKVVRDKSRK